MALFSKLQHTTTLLLISSSILVSVNIATAAVPVYEIVQDKNTSIGSQRIRANITIIAPTAQDKASRTAVVKKTGR